MYRVKMDPFKTKNPKCNMRQLDEKKNDCSFNIHSISEKQDKKVENRTKIHFRKFRGN